jgi:CO/xanthine dehydrogenase FAD-binding subunit
VIKNTFKYFSPGTLAEADELLNKYADSRIIAGRTDLIPLLKYGLINPSALISIDKINEKSMHGIEKEDGILRIGSAVTLKTLINYSENDSSLRPFRDCAETVASPQIRQTGTIGGNILQERRCFYFNQTSSWRQGIEPCFMTGGKICHQMPAKDCCQAVYYSDMATALAALSATVRIHKNGKIDCYPLMEYLENRCPFNNGILINFELEIPDGKDDVFLFKKYAVRSSIDFPISNASICIKNKNGEFSVRLFLGAMASMPLRLLETEKVMAGFLIENKLGTEELGNIAASEAKRLICPIKETCISPKVKLNGINVLKEIMQKSVKKIDR